jgi:hypothetical protein
MFLFTTPPARDAAPANPVVDAIRTGAERTGTGFDYLLATAQRESALDPRAKARTSSAAGLFQFIEQTWLGLVKADGSKHGLGDHAKAIAAKPDGTLTVDDPAMRKSILALREDPQVASVLAGAFTQRNRDMLAAELGREPSQGDLYIAHFLGARGATDLIRTAQTSPKRAAAVDFPDAAPANRSIFYDRSGRARGAGEVYALLAAAHSHGGSAAPAFSPDRPLAFARADGPAMHGLFQTTGRRGPVSEAVARLWRTNNEGGAQTSALGGFFPRSADTPGPVAEGAAAVGTAEAKPVDAPLPPPRPASLNGSAPKSASSRSRGASPLDLSAFMKWRRT